MKKLLILLILISASILPAQQPVSIHLTEKDGLPDIEFYDITEDKDGFIWLAADKGLYRYDGNKYELFTHPLKKGRSLFGLKFDTKGRLWCNNLAGQFFYVENNELLLFKDFETIKTLTEFLIFENNLIINNLNHGLAVNLETKEETIFIDNLNSGNSFSNIDSSQGLFYESINNVIYQFNALDLTYKKQITKSKIQSLKDRGESKFFKYENDLYFFKQNIIENKPELFKINTDSKVVKTIPSKLQNVDINHVYVIDNNLWVLTNKGIHIGKITKNKFEHINTLYPENFITDLFIDSNDNYWFTTINDGIFVTPNQELKTYNAIYKNNKKDISDIAIIDSLAFFAASRNGQISKISKHNIETLPINNTNEVFNIAYNPVSQKLLTCSRSSSSIFDVATQKQRPVYQFYSKSISVIDKDNYLLSLPFSASIYNEKKDTIFPILNVRSYASVYHKNSNTAYISYIDGFRAHNLTTHKTQDILNNGQPVLGSEVAINDDGFVCIATHNNGVLGFKNNKKIFSFNNKNGLQSQIINAIQFKNNTIWVATDKGIQSYNYKTGKTQNITKQDGLASGNINTLKVIDNTVLFGSNLGLFSFNSTKIQKKQNELKPYFTSISIEEKDTLLQSSYTIKQDQSEIKIEFNTNGFQTHEFVEYAYKLEGYNTNYIKIENNSNFVKFNSLPKGKFKFLLKAKNKFKDRYSNPISINLNVTSLFYKTLWFYALCAFITSLLFWFYFDKKTKRLKKEQETELEKANISKELVFTQIENLRSQMNPHFIFNALNSIQDYIILNEKKLARQYLVKFSRLIRTYLEHSQTNEVSLKEEIKALNLYLELEKERFDDDLFFKINVDKLLNLDTIYVPSLFIQPYVENALKHGLLHKKDNKKVELFFYKDQLQNILVCEITDNGIGREASAKINSQRIKNHKSFATTANQKRIHLINRSQDKKVALTIDDLVNEKFEVAGTKVTITITL
ncbi:sensor histidine kinase [Psychroserpens damuponensis]|uniref:sensor histidine kinase n=1 Tax=Psychroserpens damuponensis TaxID=943936 RepID=UPI00069504E8|nr:sensor histidine kinase [Psychroserpens damuponensis]